MKGEYGIITNILPAPLEEDTPLCVYKNGDGKLCVKIDGEERVIKLED